MSGIESWIEKLKKAEKTCLVQDGRKKIHYTFEDKTELAEEYNVQTGELVVRKWRRKSALGASLGWEYEIGLNAEPLNTNRTTAVTNENNLDIFESSSNPIFTRNDTLNAFQWRIRNLIYPADNYLVEPDEQQRQIVVKTKNKKYYKKFTIPDLDRVNLEFNAKNVSSTFSNNTLIITYTKPAEVLKMEKTLRELTAKGANKDGDVECKPS